MLTKHTPMILIMALASIVGGTSLPPTEYLIRWIPKSDLQAWSLKSKFYVGDSLVFKYNKTQGIDVQVVGRLSYIECQADNPVWTDGDGELLVQLRLPGPMYFITSIKHYCEKGLKLEVIVATHKSAPSPSGSLRVEDFVKTTWKQPWGKITILLASVGALSAAGTAILAVHWACKWSCFDNCFYNCCNVVYHMENASFNLRQVELAPHPAGIDQTRVVYPKADPNKPKESKYYADMFL